MSRSNVLNIVEEKIDEHNSEEFETPTDSKFETVKSRGTSSNLLEI